jgi:tetratricopeptide (TPR) repeat protein
MGSYSKAIELEVAAKIDKSTEYVALYHNNRGLALYNLESYQDAIRDFNQAISEVGGVNSEHYYNRGNVYMKLG